MHRSKLHEIARKRFEETGDLHAAVAAVIAEVEKQTTAETAERICADAERMQTPRYARARALLTIIGARERITVERIRDVGGCRDRLVSRVRRICCVALRESCLLSFPETAAIVGMRDHTSARTAIIRASEDERAIAREVSAPAVVREAA